ncbi:MAG: site-2 protease family protein [Nitrospinota bacterium]|nr:site-2 protease family protein [Nitrospinota bacterium]
MKRERLQWILAFVIVAIYYAGSIFGFSVFREVFTPLHILAFSANALAAVIFIYPIIVIHELGHALAGAAAGIEINRVQIGSGPRLSSFHLFGVEFLFHTHSHGGLTFPGRIPDDFIRSRIFLLTCGGVLAQALAALAGWAAFDSWWSNFLEEYGVYLPHTFTGVNILLLFLNLNPVTVHVMNMPAYSDGRQLARIPWLTGGELDDFLAAAYITGGYDLLMKDDYSGAERTFRQGLALAPRSLMLMNNLSSALISQGRCREAIQIIEEAMKAGPYQLIGCLLHVNLASAHLCLGADGDMQKALENSETAYWIFPRLPSVAIIRGAVLLEAGKTVEGTNILLEHVHPSQPIQKLWNIALGHIYLAYGHHLAGRADDAAMLISRVEAHRAHLSAYEAMMLERIQRRIGAAGL